MSETYEKTLNILKNGEEQNIGLTVGEAPESPALELKDAEYAGSAVLYTESSDVSASQNLKVSEDEGFIPLFTDLCDVQNTTSDACFVVKDGDTEVFARILNSSNPSFLTLTADGNTYAIDKKAKPITYRTMTAIIDENDSNPATCVTYADDAEGMIPGSDSWDEFFGHYPVMLLNGVEGQKLQRNDFTKYEDGTSADITTGAEGDVMICFPRRGLHIERDDSNGNKRVIISMTDNPTDPDFEYYAHTRGTTPKDKMYLGAYKASTLDSKLRSLSGVSRLNTSLTNYRTQARANGAADGNGGSGYDVWGFYQATFIQAMYILKYSNLDSQSMVGMGMNAAGTTYTSCGGTETWGMDFGYNEFGDGTLRMKLFGIEDLWGQLHKTEGIKIYDGKYWTSKQNNFNSERTGYTEIETAVLTGYGYPISIFGTSEAGFIPKEFGGSETTGYADNCLLNTANDCILELGGYYTRAKANGIFAFYINYAESQGDGNRCTTLMYL